MSLESALAITLQAAMFLEGTLVDLSDALARSSIAHLTDHGMGVPIIHRNVLKDIVPNPFVSTTSSLQVAILYASGYVESGPDKISPDWPRVLDRCRALPEQEGLVFEFALDDRPVLPITHHAGAKTIGVAEAEYAVPAAIEQGAWAKEISVANLVRRLAPNEIERLLQTPKGSSDDIQLSAQLMERYGSST